MALRRSRGKDRDERVTGFADRIATATKPEPSGSAQGEGSHVITPGLTRYQRRSANLPTGAKSLTTEEVTKFVIDLSDSNSDDLSEDEVPAERQTADGRTEDQTSPDE